jgi:hypothetical protein
MSINTDRNHHTQPAAARVHAWEMISAFALVMPEERSEKRCMLQPVADTLKPLGLDENMLRIICAEVEQAGESLRANCPGGEPGFINVRVQVSSQVMRASNPAASSKPWGYYIVKQIASSESDSLNVLDDPRCYIDLHIYREE